MGLDGHRIARELEDLVVGQHETVPLGLRDRQVLHGVGPTRLRVHHADRLFAALALHDRSEPLGEGRLEDIVLVRVHRALHHVLAETVGAGDEDHVPEPGLRVQREHHPRTRQVGADHLLHADREGDAHVVEALVLPVGDRPVGEERSEDVPRTLEQRVEASHVQVRFLLPREGRVGQVLRGGRAAHRHVGLGAVLGGETRVRQPDFLGQIGRQGRLAQPAADPGPRRRQLSHVVDVERRDGLGDPGGQPVRLEEIPVGVSGDGKAVGHLDPGLGEVAVHLAQGRVLAPHQRDVVDSQLVEKADVLQLRHGGSLFASNPKCQDDARPRRYRAPGAGKQSVSLYAALSPPPLALPSRIRAWAAARRAMGTRGPEQDT